MRPLSTAVLVLLALLAAPATRAQTAPRDRVPVFEQNLFASGGNVAWISFARDVGPGATNLDAFRTAFEGVHAAGGNTMRLWLHTTGEASPEWSPSQVGAVVGPGAGTIADIRAILDLAEESEISLMLCLWSFDMLRTDLGAAAIARSTALLTSAALTQTYIDTALTPLVTALAGHPALQSGEIFNEPEGMSTEFGYGNTQHIPMANVQRFVNQTAGAIHRANPAALVTNGAWSFKALSDNLPAPQANERNYYSDARLVAAGGDPLGTLDFYTVHYYTWGGTRISPFHHDADSWGLDKPIVVAEFFLPTETFGVPAADMYETLYRRGYAGALGWQYYDALAGRVPERENWPRALANMRAVYAAHRADVDVVIPGPDILAFSAAPRQIAVGASAVLAWTVEEATSVTVNGAPVAATGTLTVTPAATTTYTLTARDAAGLTETRTVTVEVRPPGDLNRALGRPATASSGEAGTGNADPARSVDGDPATRWSSAWDLAANPEPDNEWLAVDLGLAVDVSRVVLLWEVAYGVTYDVEASLDGQTWTTIYQERAGDGGLDDLVIAGAPRARFVRMYGRTRGTRFGFSPFEFEVYGLASARQPPAVAIMRPTAGAAVTLGTAVTIEMAATDADGPAPAVEVFAGTVRLATLTAAPYRTEWTPPVGTHTLTAVAVDSDGTRVQSAPVTFTVTDPTAIVRYEAEAGAMIGNAFPETAAGASGGRAVGLYDAANVGVAWTVRVADAGTYPIVIGYAIPFGPQTQTLVVNGVAVGPVAFAGTGSSFRTLQLTVTLTAGTNEVRIEAGGGFMQLDFLDVVRPTAGEGDAAADGFALGAVSPNPVRGDGWAAFTLAEAGPVRLDVFDALGRRVATLADGERAAGEHRVRFTADGLAGGVYVLRLQAGERVLSRRLVVAR